MKNQKGITLIALVITIIVMLILVGVTISVSLNGGLFSTAKEATDETQVAKESEELLVVAMGALGEDGKVDFTKLDNSLPEGFQKTAEGTYKSPTGNIFTVGTNGTITLVGSSSEEEPETPVTPTTITLSTTQISKEITQGTPESVELTATLNNASGDLTWVSSDPDVAEISGEGTTRTITLKNAGTATITVSYGSVSATCKVTVTAKEATDLISFTVEGKTATAKEGMTLAEFAQSSYNTIGLRLYVHTDGTSDLETSILTFEDWGDTTEEINMGEALTTLGSVVIEDGMEYTYGKDGDLITLLEGYLELRNSEYL